MKDESYFIMHFKSCYYYLLFGKTTHFPHY